MTLRRSHSSELKAKVALEALKNERTITEIASIFEVHPNLVTKWKKQLLYLVFNNNIFIYVCCLSRDLPLICK